MVLAGTKLITNEIELCLLVQCSQEKKNPTNLEH